MCAHGLIVIATKDRTFYSALSIHCTVMQYRVMIVRIKSKKRIHMDKMSTRKGSTSKGAQRHKNSAAYNPSRYGQSRRVKQAAAASLGGLCSRCREKIEWKKKYDKYKPLTVPKKWLVCGSSPQAHDMMLEGRGVNP